MHEMELIELETGLRLASFLVVFFLMAVWEIHAPCRTLLLPRGRRWLNNMAIVSLNTLLLRIIFPVSALEFARWVNLQGWGMFNALELPAGLEVLLAVVILDLIIYMQHVMLHALPLLWRLHRVHHIDRDFDVTTGLRFHPLEIMLSMIIKLGAVALLGPSLLAVLIFMVLLNITAMFSHANISLPQGLDRVLRLVIVTPDMHRVHHSVLTNETNSNYGFNLSLWDRLLGTYREQPKLGHQGMVIGITGWTDEQISNRLPGMLMIPFMGKLGGYAINRRDGDK